MSTDDDVDLDDALPLEAFFSRLRDEMRPKVIGNRVVDGKTIDLHESRSTQHTRIGNWLVAFPAAYRAKAYAALDAEFAKVMADFPTRLPIEEHRQRLARIKVYYIKPLRFLGGIRRFIERRRSKAPEDRHWHVYQLRRNRLTKSRSTRRATWRRKNSRSPAQIAAEQRYYAKRKAAREAARGST